MGKKVYQKPSFSSLGGRSVNDVNLVGVMAAAAGMVASAAVTSAVHSMFEEDYHDGSLVAIRPVQKVSA